LGVVVFGEAMGLTVDDGVRDCRTLGVAGALGGADATCALSELVAGLGGALRAPTETSSGAAEPGVARGAT
jgi:hypothetical protein